MKPQPPTILTAAWTPVADRFSDGDTDRWAYRITGQERIMLQAAVAAGTALMAHRRAPGGWELVARTVPAAVRRPTHAAAVRARSEVAL